MVTQLEDFPTELFLSLFDYFWAHEIFYSFGNLNSRIDGIITQSQLHISSENQDIIDSPHRILSLSLTTPPICLNEFTNLRSLTLDRCCFDETFQFPPAILRLCIKNTSLLSENLKLILQNPTLINVQLDLHRKLTLFDDSPSFSNIQYLTVNYISLNDMIELLRYTPKLKYLHLSLFGINREKITNFTPIPTITRLTCLSMGITFDQLCSQLLSVYFPNLQNLTIFTSYVDPNVCIASLEHLLTNHVRFVKKLNVSAQFVINPSAAAASNYNIETIKTRFRSAFWLKRNCQVTFKCCNNDSHRIRLYLQANKALRRARPSRF
ncbi:unnamed protein product [Adineta ricciae]|uniref:F-box domain-containing protein n=1 Tax=Adineta ricciae TaxID=249248 RepID=A0A815RPX1_ADIRI|nr:unnamed protein product [Adineta ricciae]